ncbi:hypothetical protein K504DRAFT_106287 [Pleomassaria siparia CBS 279.74]|uniref:Uncharacterized protein n=1 Tax=Pleomassaria siparia CBS 279.74 TaxID=1314801 RepID=A0A6G1JWR8_9PLEO|nr:hypothetical protein K504DRAFT_106287 [Pleomassaria siparia CBS 279.74]
MFFLRMDGSERAREPFTTGAPRPEYQPNVHTTKAHLLQYINNSSHYVIWNLQLVGVQLPRPPPFNLHPPLYKFNLSRSAAHKPLISTPWKDAMTRLNPIAFFKASSKKPYVPSRFEQLPREIRELIYSFAGYPIHRTIWISSILRSNYETSVEVTHVELTDEKAPWPKTFAWTIMSGNDADQYLCKMDFRFPAALLQVNRMLRADLMQSLYRWKTVDIRIDLTKPSSTLSKLKNIAHFKRPTHNLGVSP